MALTPRLELRARQRMALTPGLRSRLAILRMGPLDLAEEVARIAARNPFLVFEAPQRRGDGPSLPDVQTTAVEAGFQEDLRRQLARLPLDPQTAALTDFLVAELREDGMLDADLNELATETALPVAALEAALRVVQGCEPAGIAARSLTECLHLQLVDKGLDPADAEVTVAHLSVFARRDWAALEAALGLDGKALRARADLLRGLSPRPIVDTRGAEPVVLRPDLRLERRGAGMLAVVQDETSRPRLYLDASLVRRAAADGFAPELLAQARAMIEALEQRGRTLSRIGDWLLREQELFFSDGPGALKPASRVALAAELGLHPSTVSRAVAGKAIDVDGRLWPLSVFFSAAVPGPAGPIAARAVQKRLADLIAAEAALQPLSDDSLVEKLRAEGIDIARRTVAKYRQGLRIPSSSARRRLAIARRVERGRD